MGGWRRCVVLLPIGGVEVGVHCSGAACGWTGDVRGRRSCDRPFSGRGAGGDLRRCRSGRARSGLGRENGREGLLDFTELEAAYIKLEDYETGEQVGSRTRGGPSHSPSGVGPSSKRASSISRAQAPNLLMTPGLLLTSFALGLRHGIDWDHIAAIADLSSTSEHRGRAFRLSLCYAIGHALVVFALGSILIVAGASIPQSLDEWMGRVVGATLIGLGIAVLQDLRRNRGAVRLRNPLDACSRGDVRRPATGSSLP